MLLCLLPGVKPFLPRAAGALLVRRSGFVTLCGRWRGGGGGMLKLVTLLAPAGSPATLGPVHEIHEPSLWFKTKRRAGCWETRSESCVAIQMTHEGRGLFTGRECGQQAGLSFASGGGSCADILRNVQSASGLSCSVGFASDEPDRCLPLPWKVPRFCTCLSVRERSEA